MKPHRNRGLFSNYYLDALLPKEEDFKIPISEVKAVFEKIKGIWDRSRFEAINEDQLRKHFLDKVLDYLGWVVDVNAPVPTGEWSKRPDYAFFLNNESLKTAQKGKKDDYFKKVTCIAEAKRLGRPLDKRLKTESDPFEVQIPSMQISKYLWLTGVRWGILTDGKYWRLYERETSKRLDIFYEVDLEDLIESGSPESFRYFYLLFRKEAFAEFIEKVYTGSVDYAEEVGKELKENIYQALKTLAQGFLKTSGNNLTEAHLKEIHDNSLILLYRLLFILYAEHRDLLPLGVNKLYTESYSLDAFKKEVANRFDKNEPIATSTIGYWNKLKELFEIINGGNKELGVPPYNGGLFDPEKHHFLEKYRIGDLYVAKAIDLLSRSKDKAYIDYGSLEIRHLGSIYEGLLEYKLKIADQDLVPIKDKGKEIFVSLAEAKKQKNKIREDEEVKAGEIYLVTDKGERKATGSYYTPDYIVKYIVENTLGPLVEERQKKVSEKISEIKEKLKGTKGLTREFYGKDLRKAEGSLIDEILSLKVLDPAMGSGHFLVEATDFLARELLKVLGGEPFEGHSKEMVIRESSEPYGLKEQEEEDIRWARREVVEKCIFGVDLNPMAVELAKLSLWLYTVAKNRPLNFLDHHLRCGNSLIGAKIDDLASLPEIKKKKAEIVSVQLGLFESIFKEKISILLGAFAQIEKLPSDTVEQVRQKERLYQDFRKIVSRFQDVADVWASTYFLNDVDFGNYQWQRLQNNLRSADEEWKKLGQESWFKKAKEIANEKSLFHWELEFPEVFFEGHQRKGNPGFDAVIGNPPYYTLTLGKRQKQASEQELAYFGVSYPRASEYKVNTFSLFCERSLTLVRRTGNWSFILPNTFLTNYYMKNLRSWIISDFHLYRYIDLRFRVFEEAEIGGNTLIFVKALSGKGTELVAHFTTANCREDLSLKSLSRMPQSIYLEMPYNKFLTDPNTIVLLSHILEKGRRLGEVAKIYQGIITGDNKRFLAKEKVSPKHEKILRGEDVERYSLGYGGYYVLYEPEQLWSNTAPDMFLVPLKIVSRQTGDNLVASVDFEKFFTLDSTHVIHPTCDSFYFLTLFDSRLLNFIYQEVVPEVGKTFAQVKTINLKQLPIRQIFFVTTKVERDRLVKDGKNHYKRYLETGKSDAILYFIESRLIKEHKPDAELIKKQNADPLYKNWQIPAGALWEQSDVVHDTLAFLAEQMIEMNKEKQGEIRGYLKWLESQLKIQSDTEGNTGIEALTGKTQIKNYLGDYQKGEDNLPFEEFWKILEKNKTRIQTDLKSRELYGNIRSEYEKSLSKLLPLKENLRKTDWLIDQIVYKLYGLTEQEIRIVEGHS